MNRIRAALVAAAAPFPSDEGPLPGGELELARVMDVEMALSWGESEEAILAEFTGAEILAAQRRRHVQSSGFVGTQDWQNAVGRDNFGSVRLEIDGTVTIGYVNALPDVSRLPAGVEYRFVQVSSTYDSRRTIEPIEDPDEYRRRQVSNPNSGDHINPHGGLAIMVTCVDHPSLTYTAPNQTVHPLPLNRYVGAGQISALTSTATVSFKRNGNQHYGTFTAGHGPADDGRCNDSQSSLRYTTTVENGSQKKSSDWSDGNSIGRTHASVHYWQGGSDFPGGDSYNEDTYWNRGRWAYWMTNDSDTSAWNEDSAILRHPHTTRTKAHLGPWKYATWDRPSAWDNHTTDFASVIAQDPTDGYTYCVTYGWAELSADIKGGVDCGVAVEDTGWLWYLDTALGVEVVRGDSGGVIFWLPSETTTDNPRPIGMTVVDGGPTSYELGFSLLYTTFNMMENEFAEITEVQLCSSDDLNAYSDDTC